MELDQVPNKLDLTHNPNITATHLEEDSELAELFDQHFQDMKA